VGGFLAAKGLELKRSTQRLIKIYMRLRRRISMKNATALARAAAARSTTTDGNSKTFFDAWLKLDQISHRIDDEFQTVVLNQAQQIATVDPATFDVVTFVTGWTQQTEGYRSSTTAITSFRTELNKVFDWYAAQHSDEVIEAAKEKRQALQDELDKRNEADTAIEKQIKTLDKFIGASYAAAQAGTTSAAAPAGKRGRKKAAKQPAQRAAGRAANKAKASKKGAKNP
jgi:hypothetical protein